MPQSQMQRSFAGGEIAQELYGRADQTKYQTGLKTCRNFLVMRHGGVINRAGSPFVAEVKDSSLRTYFIKFVFNDEQTYAIEAGNLYFRFYRNGARIVVSGIAAYVGATTYALGDLAAFAGVNYYSKVAGNIGNQPDTSPTEWYALTGDIYEIPTPYVTAELPNLQFSQSGDTVTIVNRENDVADLKRTGHTSWTLVTRVFAPSIVAPTSPANTGAAGTTSSWVITSIKAETYEESLQSVATESSDIPTTAAPITITWTQEPDAQEYNVYRAVNGVYAYIGRAIGGSFIDNGIEPDMTLTPPIARNPFSGADDKPGVTGYYQQRQMFANTNNEPEKIWGSRSGRFNNFTISSPLQADDAITFTIAGRKVNEVRHMIDLSDLIVLTAGAEWIVLGTADGILSGNQPANPRQIGANGSSIVTPVIVNNSLVYVQARGSIVRDLKNDVSANGSAAQSQYNGRDLTVFAPHLFEGYTLDRMDFAQIPHSVVWIARSDGALLGLTYLREHEVWGWHRHDTDGIYEDVCVVPEGMEDAVYVMVKRTINGVTKRYIERFASRRFTDIAVDAIFLDASLTYDGRNAAATTMALTTAAGWTVDDDLTIESSVGFFDAGDVGNEIVIWNGEDRVSVEITAFTDTQHVTGSPNKTVPTSLRATALTTWGKAVDQLAGLDHLEAKDVGVFADGHVVANPLNDAYTTVTVAGGSITLERPYLVIHVGLSYLCDIKTLDLDVPGAEIRDREKLITSVSLLVKDTRGLFIGPDEDNLNEAQPAQITQYDQPVPFHNGKIEVPIAATWEDTGSFLVRQVDPLPATILAAIPSGDLGG